MGPATAFSRRQRTPETTPAISARHKSTFVSAPADGSGNFTSSPGQTEKYSPPVPSLHTGSIPLFLYASILSILTSMMIRRYLSWCYDLSTVGPPEPKQKPNKSRTAAELFFLPRPAGGEGPLYGTDRPKTCRRPGRMRLCALRRASVRARLRQSCEDTCLRRWSLPPRRRGTTYPGTVRTEK